MTNNQQNNIDNDFTIENRKVDNNDWREEFKKKFSGQSPLSQAILSALEYRGFYDCGKYLDEDISEKILPIILDFIASTIQSEIGKGEGK